MRIAEAMSGMAQERGAERGREREPAGEHEGGGGEHSELHPHGDGSYHSITPGGERTEHPHIGHALVHLGKHHEQGKHMHVHSDGMEHTTHHAEDGGEVQGPHSHENIEALKEHLGQFFNEESHEGSGGGGNGRKHESIFE